mmetsp:Transcript_32034/g.63512  ORF Transcript_32034/g.63512 Transcript_32034/m.63512 type:complete len:82 (-) Transcript_32034:453-698(-)
MVPSGLLLERGEDEERNMQRVVERKGEQTLGWLREWRISFFQLKCRAIRLFLPCLSSSLVDAFLNLLRSVCMSAFLGLQLL